ncbi:MAG TPA: PEGA domain-containing protein [Polyangia bacterium]
MNRLVALVLIFSLVTLPGLRLARADDASPQPVHVTSFLLDHPGVPEQVTTPVMLALNDGLRRNPRLEMKDLGARLADFAQEIPQDQIDQGRLLLSEGQKALLALDLPTARKKLTDAVDALSKVLPHIKKAELADAMMALAAAQFEDGDKKLARQTLVRLLTWREDYRLDTSKYPPALIAPVEEARREVARAKRGSLEIHTDPTAAQAYVDGRYVGVTPTFAEGLPVGEHWVTIKREGYKKAVKPADVSSRVQELINVTLDRSSKYLLVDQALKGIEKSIGAPTLDDSIDNLTEVLFIDHAVFVRATPAQAGQITVDAYLYDLRTRRRLARVTKTVPEARADKQLGDLASALYLNVSYESELEAPKDAPPPKAKTRRKFYKTWWFWTVAGVVAAGVVVGGTLGTENAPKSCGAGNFCPGFTF